MNLLQPGLNLEGLSKWEEAGNRLRFAAGLHTGQGSSRSSLVNCMDARTVINDAARAELQHQAHHYCEDRDILGSRWNRLTIPGGGARLSRTLFPADYAIHRADLHFVAHHQFVVDDQPCMVILITHVNCGMLAEVHRDLSFEGALTATYDAGVEIAQELDDRKRGAVVVVVADGLVGDESEGIERYRFCGLILSQTRSSLLPAEQRTLTERARTELTAHLG